LKVAKINFENDGEPKMKQSLILLIVGIVSLQIFSCVYFTQEIKKEDVDMVSVIPKPQIMRTGNGTFQITKETIILTPTDDNEALGVAKYFANRIKTAGELRLKFRNSNKSEAPEKTILFFRTPDLTQLGKEGYQLIVTRKNIVLKAAEPAGLFYGVQTLFQLLPPEIYSSKSVAEVEWNVPAVEIKDVPRFGWRGMMLDVSRHFFPKEFIYEFIDYLAKHKLNTFHWHLCDDQGWRIEIKKYPKLTDVGAWRMDRLDKPWNARESQKEGEIPDYGGFYTQDEIRNIVKYAKSRHVTIIPEIEMPGHTVAALAAYPQFSCEGGPFQVLTGGYWPISDIYCAGNDSTFDFLENILSEVIDLFPGKYIHIGGDEAEKSKWKKCEKCQARIKNEGLSDEHELQSYFIKRIEEYLNSQGRQLIGWDEILEGGLAPGATVMSWRGFEGGIAAAKSGHDVVMSPTSHCYFDYYQGDPDQEPLAIGGYLPLKKVYSFDPTPQDLTEAETHRILGGQANVWTEYMLTPDHVRYMIFPRMSALSEVLWSSKEKRNWNDFKHRLETQLKRYDNMGINYAKSAYNIQTQTVVDLSTKEFTIKLETEIVGPDIFYSLDGRNPTLRSTKYAEPIVITKTTQLKARSFLNGKPVGKLIEETYKFHKATGKKVTIKNPYAPKYTGGDEFGLTNSLRGGTNYSDGRWQGFEQKDLEAVVDLESVVPINKITSGFLNHIGSWIFLPKYVEYAVSDDGENFKILTKIENELPENHGEKVVKEFSASFDKIEARYVKVLAKNVGICPDWHQGAGGKTWLFVDEIIVE